MSYGQPCRRITAGPLAGPASAYPILRVPASICFSGANEALVSGGVALPPPGFALLDRASAEPVTISLAAATDIAMAPNSRRRLPLITSDILIELILNLLIRYDRVHSWLAAYKLSASARETDAS